MTEVASVHPFIGVLVPALGAIAIALAHNHPDIREVLTGIASVGTLVTVVSMVPAAVGGAVPVTRVGPLVPGIDLVLRADPFGLIFALVAAGLWVLTGVYSVGYMRGLGEHAQTRYYVAFAASIAATMGVAFAANLLVLLIFYELLTIATYPLVAHEESPAARRAGYKYLVYAFSGGVVVFAGVLVVQYLAGTVTFTPGGIQGLVAAGPLMAEGAFLLLAMGFAVKAAMMPVHAWLPDAMVAPTPVSGLLHAVAVVKAGAFGVGRTVMEIFGPAAVATLAVDVLILALAAVTLILGSVLALRQDDLKRLLAYSTIAQLSYIVAGMMLLAPMATVGGILHVPAHAFAKLTLFFCAGVIVVEVGTRSIDNLAGIGRRMPLTMGAFTIGSLSLAGLPLLGGFVSKFHLVAGGYEVLGLGAVALFGASGVLTIAYLWPVIYTAYFESPGEHDPKPLVTGPMGGRGEQRSSATQTKTESEPAEGGQVIPDGGAGDTGTDGWTHHPPTGSETTPWLWVPVLGTAGLALALGVVPEWLAVYDLAIAAAESAWGGAI